ncbi:hypothetical protein PIB30_034357 [Stylosanthes scabra]|uniref:TIR domain-containing protein n=1 Tax=Stylosanthes scabra TaxID=79078 RepID=A0ABU6VBV2_9FABA|nr:hypothetical protein [Stylosanthes scabra]
MVTATAWCWSWTLCVFITGFFLGSFISGKLINLKYFLERRFWNALLLAYLSRSQQQQENPTPALPPLYKYDVFLSFCGIDTRNTFIDHLYRNLTQKCIYAFKDDQQLQRGESVPLQLMEAIKHSRAAIVVFSTNYAASTWCLDEMAAIADRHRESTQLVIPIFYDVDPSDVRKQKGPYWDAFISHACRFRRDLRKVLRWKIAMTYLANLTGHDIRDKRETTQIECITRVLIEKLDHKFSPYIDDLIGIQPHIEELERRLELNSNEANDVRILGIWGMGGIGKTTHAKVLYDKISYAFDACCFIEDVSKLYTDHGPDSAPTEVRKAILRQTVQEEKLETQSPNHITSILHKRLCNSTIPKKVLIVLDNVDEATQWSALGLRLLGRGSRVIIITRNKHILNVCGADAIYEVPLLNDNDALELFLRKAFRNGIPKPKIISDITREILDYAQSLPLAIEELGYALYDVEEKSWKDALESWRNYPKKNVMNVLQKSYDQLNENEGKIFLDIACFFAGKRKDFVEHILSSRVDQSYLAIQNIRKNSLITIKNQEIHMHKMLQELGKKIARGDHSTEPKYWTRLWRVKDLEEALMSNMEENKNEAIVLDDRADVTTYSHLRIQGLFEMKKLALLILHFQNFPEPSNFPNLQNAKMRYLLWHGYPFSSFPIFIWRNLVELNLPNSRIQRLWDGIQFVPNLKRMDLRNSKLTITPNFLCCRGLVRLDLTGCRNLIEVHESIGLLRDLDYLSLRDCSSLAFLNFGSNCQLISLRTLLLSGCTNLRDTPDLTGLSNLSVPEYERQQCENLLVQTFLVKSWLMAKDEKCLGTEDRRSVSDFRVQRDQDRDVPIPKNRITATFYGTNNGIKYWNSFHICTIPSFEKASSPSRMTRSWSKVNPFHRSSSTLLGSQGFPLLSSQGSTPPPLGV